MKILVSNDDGYDAEGIVLLSKIAHEYTSEIVIFAPDRNRSASSFSITKGDILVEEVACNVYKVFGTPSDCMIIALEGFFDWKPDLVLSGINLGANLGSDVVYSGTVSVAMQALWHGIPGVAFSLCSHNSTYFNTAKHVVGLFLAHYFKTLFLSYSNLALSVNIPPVSISDWAGFAYTNLGKRDISQPIACKKISETEHCCVIGGLSGPIELSNKQDFWAVHNHYASITSLSFIYSNPISCYDPSWMVKL